MKSQTEIPEITANELVHFVNEITHAMNQSPAPEQLLDKILQACIESTKADSGSIMLLDPRKNCLRVHAARGLNIEIQDLELKLGEGVTGWVAQQAKPRIVANAHKEKDYVSLRRDLLSELAVPMLVKEQVLGVLSVDSKKANLFSQKHLLPALVLSLGSLY